MILKWILGFINALLNRPQEMPPKPVKPPISPDIVPPVSQPPESPADRMARVAREALGTDPSTPDMADDELGCADTVSIIIRRVYPDFKHTVSTIVLLEQLKKSPHFKGSLDPVPGCIIVSPRQGDNAGHTGIYTQANKIASNNSFGALKGKFTENYTRESWREYFIIKRRLKGYFFIPV